MNEKNVKKNKSLSFSVLCKAFDWGPANNQIVIDFGHTIDVQVDNSYFELSAKKKVFDWKTETESIVEKYISIKRAFLSSSTGQAIDAHKSTSFITLDLTVHPDCQFTSPFHFEPKYFLNQKRQVEYSIQIKRPLIIEGKDLNHTVITNDCFHETVFEGISKFSKNHFEYQDLNFGSIILNYALFSPNAEGKIPLIILLHGAGEGGTDLDVALLGNKVIALTESKIQDIFGGFYLLVPQAPDMWMNDGSNAYTSDGESKYTNALISLIDHVVKTNTNIDSERIYIGGGSNGGFMTINLLLRKPNFFAAAFPICQAYKTNWIDGEDLATLMNVPLWMVHGVNDTVVPCTQHSQSLYFLLQQSSHSNLYLTLLNQITDQTGYYKDESGQPYRYDDHWAWIPVYNNEIVCESQSLFKWLANQRK